MQLGTRRRIAAGEQSDLVSLPHELFREVGDDSFGAAVSLRRNAFGERRDLRDLHVRKTAFVVACPAMVWRSRSGSDTAHGPSDRIECFSVSLCLLGSIAGSYIQSPGMQA